MEVISFECKESNNQNLTFKDLCFLLKTSEPELTYNIFKKWGMVNECDKFTNLAFLLSDQCDYTVECIIYDINLSTKYIVIKGNLLRHINRIYELITNSNKSAENKNTYVMKYSTEILYYVIYTMVINRNYSINHPMRIEIFDGCIKFVAICGELGKDIFEDFDNGIYWIRNKNLAKFLYYNFDINSRIYSIGSMNTLVRGNKNYIDCKISSNTLSITIKKIRAKHNIQIENYINSKKAYYNDDFIRLIINTIENGDIKESFSRKYIELVLEVNKKTALQLINIMLNYHILIRYGRGRNTRYHYDIRIIDQYEMSNIKKC